MALDGNPIFHQKTYIEFCLNTCPNLKSLDLRKITPEMRETNPSSATKEKKSIEDSNGKSEGGANVSTDVSPDKPPVNGDDISPEGLLEVIS